jgi:hypothetical protein
LGRHFSFGAYNGINVFPYGLYEAVPYILMGKFISVGATANYSRSLTIVRLADKLILGKRWFYGLCNLVRQTR